MNILIADMFVILFIVIMIQIVNKNLLNYWFSSKNYPDKRIIRSEDIRYLYLTINQLVVIPKQEICAHFDGFPHTKGTNREIADYQIRPSKIPEFEFRVFPDS